MLSAVKRDGVCRNLNLVRVQLPAGKMLTELDIEISSGGSGKKGRLHITTSYSGEKTTTNVSAVNDPFPQPLIIRR